MKSETITTNIVLDEAGHHEAVCNLAGNCEGIIELILDSFGEKEIGISPRWNALHQVKRNLKIIEDIVLQAEEKLFEYEEQQQGRSYGV